MVAQSSAAQTMAALVAEKVDLRLDRDRGANPAANRDLPDPGLSKTPTFLWGIATKPLEGSRIG
jgi:hypothetical protein